MNKFEQEYIKIINEWNFNILLEANLKSLIPNIQQKLLLGKSYQDLTNNEKQDLQSNLDYILNRIEKQVNEITDNKQYQSWIYNILKSQDDIMPDLKPIQLAVLDFIKLIKRPDLKPEQKNIQNYKSLDDLKHFINQFKEEHKLSNNIYNSLKKIYQNEEFIVYFINASQYKECNKLFGGNDYFNTGWCVAKNPNKFNEYLDDFSDDFDGYFVFIKDNKPFALLHYGSLQFKDDSNKKLETDNPNIIDCLIYINNNLNDYYKGDLKYYGKQLFLKENPNATKEDLIAFEIGGEYNKETKTIDCKGNKVKFKEEWLDENGTFDFNLINTSNNWSYMFAECTKLTKLPDNFTIPNSVKECGYMFSKCEKLTKLPNNFSIPNNSKYCYNMFDGCTNLRELPDNFNIPDSVIYCDRMFYECENLIKLPDNFTISNSVLDCKEMFYSCSKLTKLPDNFSIPNTVTDCKEMFYSCSKLTDLPDNFRIPENSDFTHIFSNSGLQDKYKIKDLLR